MCPNDLIFFPVKIEISPDLMVEISTGNTPEISTSNTLKSGNMAQNWPKNPNFSTQNLLPTEISTGPKFFKIEKFEVSASFCTLNQVHRTNTRKSRADRSWRILVKI